MKKSIIIATLLTACSLLANAELQVSRPVKSTTDFDIDSGSGEYVGDTNSNKYLKLESTTVTSTPADVMNWGNAGDLGDSYIPSVDVGKGATWTMTITYDITKKTDSEVYLSACKFTYVAFDKDGEIFYDNLARGIELDIAFYDLATGELLVSDTKEKTVSDAGTYANNTHGLEFEVDAERILNDVKGTLIKDDFYIVVTAKATEATKGTSAYYGFRNAELSFVTVEETVVTAVPEPTTATLSLLAIAGLAARRRRNQ